MLCWEEEAKATTRVRVVMMGDEGRHYDVVTQIDLLLRLLTHLLRSSPSTMIWQRALGC